MSLRSFEHALARLQKVFELLDGVPAAPFAGKLAEYSQWLYSYNKNGICFNPDPAAFNVFVAHVKEAEESLRRGALNDALCEAYEAMRDLASPALTAAQRDSLIDLPSTPNDLLGGTPGVPGNSRTASGPQH
jgi:hypothetical protein